jgi:hypothetical protein
MTVKAFDEEPEVLYVALDYARHSGMAVNMAPTIKRDRRRS